MTMRVLLVHNRYQQAGGEDAVFESERDLLADRGHVVKRLIFDNSSIAERRSPLTSARLATSTIWSQRSRDRVRGVVREFQPDVVHFHNTFPLVSPAAFSVCKREGAAVVQTLHNYRLVCPNGLFFRDGKPCEDCLGRLLPWPGVKHACYRDSRPQSSVVAAMLAAHRLRRTWLRDVDLHIALTEFVRQKLAESGIPLAEVIVKPNFVYPDPGLGHMDRTYALFVGRLAPEKGIDTLLAAWSSLGSRVPLKIVGDGPLASSVIAASTDLEGIEWLGHKPPEEIVSLMRQARFLVFPSTWYEGLPRTIIEAFAVGTPVMASDIGAMSSVVSHGETGLRFRPGDPHDLVAAVEWALSHDAELTGMRQMARLEFETRYAADRNYEMLMAAYKVAISRSRATSQAASGTPTIGTHDEIGEEIT
jgi:glycosyltransferase involved in cell wall biosynthesis